MFARNTVQSVAKKISQGLNSGELDLSGSCDPEGAYRYRLRTWAAIVVVMHAANLIAQFIRGMTYSDLSWWFVVGQVSILVLVIGLCRDMMFYVGLRKTLR